MYYIDTSLGCITFETEDLNNTKFTWNVDYEFNCKNFHTEDDDLLFQLFKRYHRPIGVSVEKTKYGYYLIVKTEYPESENHFKIFKID